MAGTVTTILFKLLLRNQSIIIDHELDGGLFVPFVDVVLVLVGGVGAEFGVRDVFFEVLTLLAAPNTIPLTASQHPYCISSDSLIFKVADDGVELMLLAF